MNILIACEESQAITIEMRKRGHNCFSADLQECSGGHPEWHINGDCLPLLNGNCEFVTQDGNKHRIEGKWDMIIAHPPCTYLTNVATRHHSLSCTPLDKINERTEKRIEAMKFFMTVINADCDKIAVENPVGVMNTCYRKPDQTIHPYMFAESENDKENYVTKATCLWLKGLEPLKRKEIEKTIVLVCLAPRVMFCRPLIILSFSEAGLIKMGKSKTIVGRILNEVTGLRFVPKHFLE